MEYNRAKNIAGLIRSEMAPFCEKAEIAGSIRRERPEVKDIELCVVPWNLHTEWPGGLFEPEVRIVNQLFEWAQVQKMLTWIKPGTPPDKPEPGIIKPDGKYWRGRYQEMINVDIFIASPENWGAIFLIRTGPAPFSEAVVTHAKHIGKPCKGGFFTMDGEPFPTHEEDDAFAHLNLEFVPPYKRMGSDDLRARRLCPVVK